MRSILRLGGLAVVVAGIAQAQDAVILSSGQTLKGHVLRYDSSRFSILVSNEVRELYTDDIHSIFFGVESESPAAAASAAPEASVIETTATATFTAEPAPEPEAAPPAGRTAAEAASTNKPAAAKPPTGPVDASLTIAELLARGTAYEGKLVKLEFCSRSVIREGARLPYLATLTDGKGTLDVEFPKEAYAWVNQLPDRITYSDVMGRNPRAYYLYGLVGKGTQQVFFAGRMMPGVSFEAVGRKTKKGIKGVEYTW